MHLLVQIFIYELQWKSKNIFYLKATLLSKNMIWNIAFNISLTIHTYYTIENDALLNQPRRFIMMSCTFKWNYYFKRYLNKNYTCQKICISSCTFFLNFACVTIIGDNVNTEKSAVFMVKSKHCACSFWIFILAS